MNRIIKKVILISMSMILLLNLLFGFIIVERNVRRVAFNDYDNLIFLVNSSEACQLWIKFMGNNYIIDFKRMKIEKRPY